MALDIYFLNHSGFMLDDHKRCYVFDYNEDPAGHVTRMANEKRELWFFVTHVHGDHFRPIIGSFKGAKYFLEKDVHLGSIPQSHIYSMAVDDDLTVDGVHVHMFGSTDAGGSFLVDTGEHTFFHAGDLNWWHWLGDTEANNQEARMFFEREVERTRGLTAEYVFFPIDARLEAAREWGVLEWLKTVTVQKLLIPMHMHDIQKGGWKPSAKFKEMYPDIPLWIPKKDGEVLENA